MYQLRNLSTRKQLGEEIRNCLKLAKSIVIIKIF